MQTTSNEYQYTYQSSHIQSHTGMKMTHLSDNYSHDASTLAKHLNKSSSIDTLKRKLGRMKRKKKKSSSRLDITNEDHNISED